MISYIIITYYNWKQRQMWGNLSSEEIEKAIERHRFQKLEGFQSTKGSKGEHASEDDGIRGLVVNATPIHFRGLKWEQVIQPGSEAAMRLDAQINREYLALMDSRNIAARGNDTLDELRTAMTPCCEPISQQELDHVLQKLRAPRITNPATAEVFQGYLDYWVPKIHIAKQRDGMEYNMPHTHGTTMMMPDRWWREPDYSTFMHELAHIHQRAHSYEWSPLYEDGWKFKYVPDLGTRVRGLGAIIARSRLNPDGSDFNWLWMGASDGRARWIGAIYPVGGAKVSLIKVHYVSIPLDKVGDTWVLPAQYHGADVESAGAGLPLIANDREFMDFFGMQYNNYHPNELGAEMMETWSDNLGVGDDPSPAMLAFDKWLRTLPWIRPQWV